MNISKLKLTIDSTTIQYSSEVNAFIDNKSYALSLLSLRYHKKMFAPGHIVAKIQIKEASQSATKAAPALDKVVSLFSGKTVTLSDDKSKVAENYYVHIVSPEYRRLSDGQYVYVTLQIYSPDHKLTQNKFCKTYVNQKLSADILSLGDKSIMAKAGFTTSNTDFKNLNFLNYAYVDKKETDTKKQVKSREFLQPYLVQYNESFYDLVARTANRCGEFFFYENGKLNLGLAPDAEPSTKKVDIYQDDALSINYENSSPAIISDVDDCFVNTMGSSPKLYTNKDYVTYDEVPFEDYLGMDFQEDSFMTLPEAIFTDAWTEICKDLNTLLGYASLSSMISKIGVRITDAVANGFSKKNKANKKGNEKWVKSSDGKGASLHASEQYDSANKTARLYGSMLTSEDQKQNYEFRQGLSSKFYQFVSRAIDHVSPKMVKVNVGSQQASFSLGQYVVFESKANVAANEASDAPKPYDKYIVIDVEEVLKSDSNEPIAQHLTLLPCYTAAVSKNNISTILRVPCPPRAVPFTKTSGTQRAFIAKSGDPQGFGRVCILYPWQKEKDVPSPWIRMAVPFAPNDSGKCQGGFYFQPNPGDEVLVDYENGNIEHPFVIGTLYSGRSSISKSTRIIASQRGHSIQFNDGDTIEDFVGGIFPASTLVDKHLKMCGFSLKDWGIPSGEENVFAGGVSICDKWGLYRIDASATKRAVSINSPFGKVDINAFTGISISAPNGDIKIAGKNITLEAGNEVKIVSGKNIDEKEHDGGMLGDLVKDTVSNLVSTELAPATDMSLERTIFECFCKPVAGTLSIQSGRYMMLTAGGGKVAIPNKGYSVNGLHKKDEENSKRLKLTKSILEINSLSDTYYDSLSQAYDTYLKKYDAVKDLPIFKDLKSIKPNAKDVYEAYCSKTQELKATDLQYNGQHPQADQDDLLVKMKEIRAASVDLQEKTETLFKLTWETNDNMYWKEMNQVRTALIVDRFPAVVKNLKDKKEKFAMKADEIKQDAYKKALSRMMIEQLIGKLKIYAQIPEKPTDEVKFSSFDDYANNVKWSKYVSQLDDYEKSMSVVSKVASAVVDNVVDSMTKNLKFYKNYSEKDVWDSCKSGEILMADKGKRETINIVNGVLNRTPNTDGYDKQIKDLLANI